MRTVIGLEIHAQLLTKTKLFCGCSADYFGKPPNTNTCPVCLGMPGALPVLNQQAVEYALKAALALNCQIPERSKFDRKNYFYPDLPKGYQISQYDEPLAINGFLDIEAAALPHGQTKRVGVRRVHLEEDAGKLIHKESGSLVDFNRAGVPLIEIVTEPDLSSPAEAKAFMEELRRILRYIGVCSGDMEEGSLRCDANISVSLDEKLGTKTEIKNMNSFRAVEDALAFEEDRQKKILLAGGQIEKATLGWNADAGRVEPQRTKEEAEDYRYFPEPDLVPLEIGDSWKQGIKESLPELPAQRRKRWREAYKLPDYDVKILTEEKALADYFDAVVLSLRRCRAAVPPKEVSNWMMSELLRLVKEDEMSLRRCRPSEFAWVLRMVGEGKINRNTGKEVIEGAFKTGKPPQKIIEERGLSQISDEAALSAIADEVIKENPKQVEDLLAGKQPVLQFLIGQMMKKTKGRADPKKAAEILRAKAAAPQAQNEETLHGG